MVIKLKIDVRLVLVSAVCLSVAIAILLFLFPIPEIWIPKDSSDLAAWFQAIGSILAIGIAVLIPYVQHKKSEEKEVVVAVLHAITMSECLRVLDEKLSKLSLACSEYIWDAPGSPEVTFIFHNVSSIRFPELAGQANLSAVGMVYFRTASAAALSISDFLRSVDTFIKELNYSRDRGIFYIVEVSEFASVAATKCVEARLELEDFIELNGIYGDE